eukprot:TRINITY_DN67030_c6_g2_i1.p1 TRINITY_DN67030_c6_g2~~TRINITY_DN67030_c6_g2_i1.p1  ORF type:complete len:544 (-),score=92.74 TRINITY_DN67030_c6_g2_i1:249-1850(-)
MPGYLGRLKHKAEELHHKYAEQLHQFQPHHHGPPANHGAPPPPQNPNYSPQAYLPPASNYPQYTPPTPYQQQQPAYPQQQQHYQYQQQSPPAYNNSPSPYQQQQQQQYNNPSPPPAPYYYDQQQQQQPSPRWGNNNNNSPSPPPPTAPHNYHHQQQQQGAPPPQAAPGSYMSYPTVVSTQARGIGWSSYRAPYRGRNIPKPPQGLHQAPQVNQPPPRPTGVKKAVLIGINYHGTKARLRGCVNDVNAMKAWLLSQGFKDDDSSMVVLTDESHGHKYQPTRSNIEAAMQWLVSGVQPGDTLFFHYSGHGAQQKDPSRTEADGMDETILPIDFKKAGMITDDTIFNLLVWPLPSGVKLTAVMDCCHSGTGMDLAYNWDPRRRSWMEDLNPNHASGDVTLFSASADHQVAADARIEKQPGGAMTTSFLAALRQHRGTITYNDLINGIGSYLRHKGFQQRPQLSSTQRFDLNQPFGFDVIVPNTNPGVGRQFRKKGKAPMNFSGTGIGTLLLAGGAAIVGFELLEGLGELALGGLLF